MQAWRRLGRTLGEVRVSPELLSRRSPRTIAYVRVSTPEQAASGLGLSAQRAAIEAYASRRGWIVDEWISDEGVSAMSKRRPGLDAALSGLHSGDRLVAARLDRLSRSVHDAANLFNRASGEGWTLSTADGSIDLTHAFGRALAQIASVFAELERNLIAERTAAALRAKRAQGKHVGRRPATVATDLTARIRRARARGSTFSKIAQRLNDDSVPTVSHTGRWTGTSVRRLLLRTAQPEVHPK